MPDPRWAVVGTPAAALFAFAPAACDCASDPSHHRLIAARNQDDLRKDLAFIPNSAFMCPYPNGNPTEQDEHATPSAHHPGGR